MLRMRALRQGGQRLGESVVMQGQTYRRSAMWGQADGEYAMTQGADSPEAYNWHSVSAMQGRADRRYVKSLNKVCEEKPY